MCECVYFMNSVHILSSGKTAIVENGLLLNNVPARKFDSMLKIKLFIDGAAESSG